MDVVYPLKASITTDELRYSLRSIAANLPHDRVWVVGGRPAWLRNVEHVPSTPAGTRWQIVPDHLRAVTARADLSERFVYLNDDFFVVRPLAEVPVLYRNTLAAEVGGHQQGSAWRRGQRETLELLRRWGIRDPLNYELHVPMVMGRDELAEALARAAAARSFTALAYRSLYGNVAGVGGEQGADVKVFGRTAALPAGATFVSTNDDSFTSGRIGRQLRARFPEPCRYEA